MKKIRVLTIFGTRPEAIKMAPLVKALETDDAFESIVCVTAQHRSMLDQVLDLFEIKPDYDLNIMKENQSLWHITSEVLFGIKDILDKAKPDVVLVHGDTTTSMAASLSAFYARIPVGHVEAGLRTFEKYYPFPEEINRVFTDAVCTYHFAPTDKAVQNLINSQISKDNIYKTGNTVIDALFYSLNNFKSDIDKIGLDDNLKTILLTSHRRENFGDPINNICDAMLELVKQNKDIEIVYPVHPNPNIKDVVYGKLANQERIKLISPLEYADFCALMKKAHLILTDSGGVQEEAPSLGKPVLVLRSTTERPEAIEYGTVKLVGTDKNRIVEETQKLLNSEEEYKKMSDAINPYGDGKASERIVQALKKIN